MNQVLVARDTLSRPVDEAPAEVVQSRIDSALTAEIVLPPAGAAPPPRVPGVPELGPGSFLPLVTGLLVLLLMRLVHVRARGRRADPAAEEGALSGDGVSPPLRPRAARPAPKPVTLPPHVSAMLQRLDQRRLEEAAARVDGPEVEGPPSSQAPHGRMRPGGTGLDVWIGRPRDG